MSHSVIKYLHCICLPPFDTLSFSLLFNSDEPNSDRQRLLQNREREFHQELQETVANVIAPRLNEFVNVLKNPPAVCVNTAPVIANALIFITSFIYIETYPGNNCCDIVAAVW